MKVIGKMVISSEETRKLQSESHLEHTRQMHLKRCLEDELSINFQSGANVHKAFFNNREVTLGKMLRLSQQLLHLVSGALYYKGWCGNSSALVGPGTLLQHGLSSAGYARNPAWSTGAWGAASPTLA